MARMRVSELAQAPEAHQAGQPGARETLIKRLRGLVDLYPGHIWKEDYLLFPMTERVLNQDEMARLLRQFDQVEQALGADVHARMISMAERLTQITIAPAAASCELTSRPPSLSEGG